MSLSGRTEDVRAHPADRDADPTDGRSETETEKLDRNWNELLQELRVLETGTQILTGFLLTVAFQQRFTDLTPFQVGLYLVLVSLAAVSTILALTPVALHRGLFRQGAKAVLVQWTDRLLKAAFAATALAIVGVAVLLFDVAASFPWAIGAGIVSLLLVIGAWFVLPIGLRRAHGGPSAPV